MNPFLVAPSILSADFSRLGEEVESVRRAGADWVHVDVMDGHFVPNLTIGAPVVKSLRKTTKMILDCHLIIENPEQYVEDFAKAGADYITFHIEATRDAHSLIQRIRDLGVKPGITLKPSTAIESIFPYLHEVDLVLIMTVNPGFSGQTFMREQVVKIDRVRRELTKLKSSALIEVDGGINAETAKELGLADVLVAGNFVFLSKDYSESITQLKNAKASQQR